jgi:hypothetical protein
LTVKLTIEISSPLTKKDHVILRNATMVMLAIANEEIGIVVTPPDETGSPQEESDQPATRGVN